MKEEYLKEGLEIVKKLNSLTYQAYIVGGAVRDFIMHNDFMDIDIATSATPDEVMKIFPNVKSEFKDLGFVTIKKDDMVFEISTFKQEIYTKPRKPSKIYYSQSLLEDIKRRDFTINALALTDKMQVVDLVKGERDLRRKRIQVIGKAKIRFTEDPIRILRAYELISRFNFHLTLKTATGIHKMNKSLRDISNYQISKALNKIFQTPYGKKAVKSMVYNNTNKSLVDYSDGLYIISKHYKKLDLIEKFAVCYAYNKKMPANTSFDKVTITKINSLLECIEATKGYTKDNNVTGKDIINYGFETIMSSVKINHLIRRRYPKLQSKVKSIYSHLAIHSIKDLKINGSDIVNINGGVTGKYVGDVINELAEEVVVGMIKNDYMELATRTKEILKDMQPISVTEDNSSTNELDKVKPFVEDLESDNKTNIQEDLIDLKIKFDMEFNERVQSTMEVFKKGDETPEELDELRRKVSVKVRDALLAQNREYIILQEKGII